MPGPNTFVVGPGWADASGAPSYPRGGNFGFPYNAMAGQGPNQIRSLADTDVDLGAVEITEFLTQVSFAPQRQMRLQVFKN